MEGVYYFRPRAEPTYASFPFLDLKIESEDDVEIAEKYFPSSVTIDCSEGKYLSLENLRTIFNDIITIYSTDEDAYIVMAYFKFKIGRGRYSIPNFLFLGSVILHHEGCVKIEVRQIDIEDFLRDDLHLVHIVIPVENIDSPIFDTCIIWNSGVDNIRRDDLCKIPVRDNSKIAQPFLDIGFLHKTPDILLRLKCKRLKI